MSSSQKKGSKAVYYEASHPASFGGINRLARHTGRRTAEKFLEGSDAYTLFRETKRPRVYRKTLSLGLRDVYQADLVEIQKIAKYNDGKRYILFVIDTFSRFLTVVPIARKTGEEVVRALKIVFRKMGKSRRLCTDRGREFYGRLVLSFLEKNDIKLYSVNSKQKASIVERVQRTIMSRVYKYFEYARTKRLIEILPEIVESYNFSHHRTLNARPVDVTPQNQTEFFFHLFPDPGRVKIPKFRLGEHVRISKDRHVLVKKYKQSFTDEVFIVDRIRLGVPNTYHLVDMVRKEPVLGSFYEAELQRVSLAENKTWIVEKILRRRRAPHPQYLVK